MLKIGKLNTNNNLIVFSIIFLVTFAVYWNSLQGDFVWDDKGLILNNANYLNDWKNLFSVFTKPFFGKAPTYRPLLIVSFIFDYKLWNSHPFGFHYTNVLIHIMNAFMVYLLAFLLFKHRYLSLFSSLVFISHPIQTESVAWISGRNDVILTFFSLLTILFYIRWYDLMGVKRVLAFVGFLTAYGCALLTKESGIILLLLIILIDYFFQPAFPKRVGSKKKAYLSIILVSFLYIYLRMKILGNVGLGHIGEDFSSRLMGFFVIYAYYFKILLLPIHQTANPFIPYLSSIKDPVVISSFLFAGSVLLVIAICWKHFREMSFSILWVFISLLSVSGITPLTVPALEHRLYLGTVGFSFLLPLLVYRGSYLKTNGAFFKKAGTVMVSLLLTLIVIYSTKTVVRNTVWKNESHFWLKTVEASPLSVFAHSNLGLVYVEDGQYSQAIKEFRKALSLNPGAENVYANLGAVYVLQGFYHKAIDAYEKALKLGPKRATFYNGFGKLYYQALKEYKISSKLDSVRSDARDNLVAIYGKEGLYQKSLDNYKKALQLDSDNAEAHNNLGDLYYLKGFYKLAAEEYKQGIRLNPYYAEAYNNLGLIYFDEKHYDDAQGEFLKALDLEPDFAEACNNLALTYFNMKLYKEALEGFNRALKLMPENGGVHFNLALVYLEGFKDRQKAVYCLRESLRIDPYHSRAAEIKEVLAKLKSDKVSGK